MPLVDSIAAICEEYRRASAMFGPPEKAHPALRRVRDFGGAAGNLSRRDEGPSWMAVMEDSIAHHMPPRPQKDARLSCHIGGSRYAHVIAQMQDAPR